MSTATPAADTHAEQVPGPPPSAALFQLTVGSHRPVTAAPDDRRMDPASTTVVTPNTESPPGVRPGTSVDLRSAIPHG